MPSNDITFCSSRECPIRNTCARQDYPREGILPHSYGDFYFKDLDNCGFYISNQKTDGPARGCERTSED